MIETLDGATRLFPIIGDPIRFVKSPQQLTRGFVARGHNAVCLPMQVVNDDLDVVMRALTLTGNVDGLLVTMPHKQSAFAYCTSSSNTARLLGAVSVMRRNADGTWHGDMLDGLAFVKAQTAKQLPSVHCKTAQRLHRSKGAHAISSMRTRT
jgi:shikimate dehydrogenase